MVENAVLRCEKCGSEELMFIQQCVNQQVLFYFVCANCDYKSPALEYLLDDSVAMQKYICEYKKRYEIKCSIDEFKEIIRKNIIEQVIKSRLVDESGKIIIKERKGFFRFI